MPRYLAKRIALAIPTFLGITLVTFAVIRIAPGDPALAAMGTSGPGDLSPATYERLRRTFALDEPVWRQYVLWVGRVARLDFGRSFHDGRRVSDKILERLPATISLAGGAIVLSLAMSIPIGMASAARRGRPFDTVVGTLLYALFAVPHYVMAMILIVVVGVEWGWLPFYGMMSDDFADYSVPAKAADLARHFVLILICFTYPLVAYQARFIRGNLLEELGQDYIRTARAKGLSEFRVFTHHAMRNTLIPLITHLGLLLPALLGGSVILETMFGWPGVGQLFFQALLQRDYPTVMALSVTAAVLVLVGTLLADLTYALVDPRVRYE